MCRAGYLLERSMTADTLSGGAGVALFGVALFTLQAGMDPLLGPELLMLNGLPGLLRVALFTLRREASMIGALDWVTRETIGIGARLPLGMTASTAELIMPSIVQGEELMIRSLCRIPFLKEVALITVIIQTYSVVVKVRLLILILVTLHTVAAINMDLNRLAG